jgi:hypothetical protein
MLSATMQCLCAYYSGKLCGMTALVAYALSCSHHVTPSHFQLRFLLVPEELAAYHSSPALARSESERKH